VLILHFVVTEMPGALDSKTFNILQLGRLAWSGVDLFFVLSGFLIGGILIDERTSPNYFKAFYVRRFYRIFPLYFLMLFLFFLGVWSRIDKVIPALEWLFANPLRFISYATFTQNFFMARWRTFGPNFLGITWSLAIEEQFYLTLPLVIRCAKPRWMPRIVIASIIAAPIIRVLLYYILPEPYMVAHVLMPCRADALMLGVGAALLVRSRAGCGFLLAYRRSLYAALGVLFLGVAYMTFNDSVMLRMTVGFTWLAFFYCTILLLALSHASGWVGRLFRISPLTHLGILAYGLYLFHRAIEGLCYAMLRHKAPAIESPVDVAVTLLAVILTILIASLSWRYFEKPLIKRGHSYSYGSAETKLPEPGAHQLNAAPQVGSGAI
jgi:peptidoglycan/LPS O-acetylase OafA/YrhL